MASSQLRRSWPGTAALDGPMAWPRHCGTASLCFRLGGPPGLGSPEIRWREPHVLFGSPEKAALALGSGLACFFVPRPRPAGRRRRSFMKRPDISFTITVNAVVHVYGCRERQSQEARGYFGFHDT